MSDRGGLGVPDPRVAARQIAMRIAEGAYLPEGVTLAAEQVVRLLAPPADAVSGGEDRRIGVRQVSDWQRREREDRWTDNAGVSHAMDCDPDSGESRPCTCGARSVSGVGEDREDRP